MFGFLAIVGAVLGASGGGEDSTRQPLAMDRPPGAQAPGAQVEMTTLEAEPQIPTGKFTIANEVRPILQATQGSWVAVREYDGQDLLYVTHLLAWRCGLKQIRWSVNGGPLELWPMPACHVGTATPNALTAEDGLPFRGYALGEVQTVTVEIVYDDLERVRHSFERPAILMP